MRIALGIATIVAAAASVAVWMRPGAEAELAVVTDIGRGGVATLSMPTAAAAPAPAENVTKARFFGSGLSGAQQNSPAAITAAPAPQATVAAAPSAPSAPTKASWSNDVVIYAETQAAEVRPTPVSTKPPSPAAAQPPRDKPRAELVRDIQRELRRIGCYAGEVNGEWNSTSKRGLRAFMDHVGSRVQSDDPDLIQLTLVRGFPGIACRPANGQMMATKQPVQAPVATTAPPAVATVPAASTTRVATAPVEQPQAAPAAVTAPLEGRMAVGGPVPEGGMPPVTGAPFPAPAKAQARPAPRPRQDRAWLNNFFNN